MTVSYFLLDSRIVYRIIYLSYSPIVTTSYKVDITWQQELWYQNCGHNCKNRTNFLQSLKMAYVASILKDSQKRKHTKSRNIFRKTS